jgi:hypothetical protein
MAAHDGATKLTNFYELIDGLDDPYFNPNPNALQHPFRCCIVGASGSGKSNLLLNVVTTCNNFARIWICTKMPDEPLYRWLAKTLRDELESEDEVLTIVGSLSDLPQHDDYLASGGQQLVVIDDFVSENIKAHKPVIDLAIMGRKLGHRGVSLVYISQKFYDIPKMIRAQSNYIILKRISSSRELRTIVKDFGLGISVDELQQMYNQTALDPFSMFLIDLVNPDDNRRFRLNF